MTGLYPYCIVRAGVNPPRGLVGIGGGPVDGYDVGPFTVWASEEDAAPPTDLERVSAHHEVVRAAAEATTALPVRFGSWAPSRSELTSRIEESSETLAAALESADGRIEMGVRVEDVSRPPVVAAPTGEFADGRTYLRVLSERYAVRDERRAAQDAAVADIERCLEGVPHESRVKYLEPPGLVSVAHLVAREDEGRYRRGLGKLCVPSGYGGRLNVTGPWPPYSFTNA